MVEGADFESQTEQVDSHRRTGDDDEPKENESPGEGRQHEEPEPDEDVDLLVDNVERQQTERVHGLDVGRGTILVEATLGHAREYPNHRVDSLFCKQREQRH